MRRYCSSLMILETTSLYLNFFVFLFPLCKKKRNLLWIRLRVKLADDSMASHVLRVSVQLLLYYLESRLTMGLVTLYYYIKHMHVPPITRA